MMICVIVCVLGLGLPSYGAEYVHNAQDLLNAGRRTDSVDALALDRYLSMAGRMGEGQVLGMDFLLAGKFFYGFPVLSDYGVMRSDLFRIQGSSMLAWRLVQPRDGHPLDLFIGVHGVRYGLSTPVSLPLPLSDPVDSEISVADFVSDQFYDDLVELRLVLGGLGSCRVGWVQNEVYASTIDGRVERDNAHLVARNERWVFEIEALSLLRFRYRMDSATRIDSWQLSSDVFAAFALWLASKQNTSFVSALVRTQDNPEASRKAVIAKGLPWLNLSLKAENYYRDSLASVRGSTEPNLVWELEAGKRFYFSGGSAWLELDARFGIFSRSWARWHDGRRVRELSLGIEVVIDLGGALPTDSIANLFVNWHTAGSKSIRMAYFMRGGSFTDAGLKILEPDKGITVSGYRVGTRVTFWDAIEIELAYAENDPADLKHFVESVGRGVFMFHIGYRY